jgi:DNA segregation ATPase FtsK/SpoIIIE-like protein
MENKTKLELYNEKQNKITLDKQEIENIEFSKNRHQENEATFETIMIVFKSPYYIFWKFPKWLIHKITFKEKRNEQEKEIKRLKLVMDSKEMAREKMKLENVMQWENKYLISDGIFPIGEDIKTGKLVIIDFNINANLLIGGMPGSGKSKLVQLIIFQCLKHNANVYIGDFKGGVDFQRFENKCTVITEHEELFNILKYFRKEINNRIKLFKSVGAENLKEYNEITGINMKRQYLFIDELGEAMEIFDIDGYTEKEIKQLKKEIENNLKSIARLGRAFGLNLVCGTQRPDVGILEGQIRDQFGHRVCFKALQNTSNIVLSSKIASELPDIKGRSMVMSGVKFIETQVFLWDKESIKEIKNKKLSKNDLKIVKTENENIENRETEDTIDYDFDY